IEVAPRDRTRLAVARIDGERIPEHREVDPHLVRATGARTAGASGERAESLERRDIGARLQSLSGRRDPHRSAPSRGQALFAPPLRVEVSSHESEVHLFRPSRLEGPVQGALRLCSQAEEDYPARVAVETVHGERIGSDLPDEPRKGSLALASAARRGRKARRFVDRKDEIVAMEDPQHLRDARTRRAARPPDALPLACPRGPCVPAAARGLARHGPGSTFQRASVTEGATWFWTSSTSSGATSTGWRGRARPRSSSLPIPPPGWSPVIESDGRCNRCRPRSGRRCCSPTALAK